MCAAGLHGVVDADLPPNPIRQALDGLERGGTPLYGLRDELRLREGLLITRARARLPPDGGQVLSTTLSAVADIDRIRRVADRDREVRAEPLARAARGGAVTVAADQAPASAASGL